MVVCLSVCISAIFLAINLAHWSDRIAQSSYLVCVWLGSHPIIIGTITPNPHFGFACDFGHDLRCDGNIARQTETHIHIAYYNALASWLQKEFLPQVLEISGADSECHSLGMNHSDGPKYSSERLFYCDALQKKKPCRCPINRSPPSRRVRIRIQCLKKHFTPNIPLDQRWNYYSEQART